MEKVNRLIPAFPTLWNIYSPSRDFDLSHNKWRSKNIANSIVFLSHPSLSWKVEVSYRESHFSTIYDFLGFLRLSLSEKQKLFYNIWKFEVRGFMSQGLVGFADSQEARLVNQILIPVSTSIILFKWLKPD